MSVKETENPETESPKLSPSKVEMVPMRDGTRLYTEVYMPSGSNDCWPTVLVRTPYPDSLMPFSDRPIGLFCDAGYCFVIQSCRGTWKSEGDFERHRAEPFDGYDTIEWIASQGWSNAKVGMMGSSYAGSTQWLAARTKPPHLTCIAPQSPAGMFFYESPYMGGALVKSHLMAWPCLVRSNSYDEIDFKFGDLESDIDPDDRLYKALRQSPNEKAIVDWHGEDSAFIKSSTQALRHPTLDGWWKEVMLTAESAQHINIPVLTITGFYDGNQAGCLYNWAQVEEVERTSRQCRHLMVGPWRHAQMRSGQIEPMGEVQFLENANRPLPEIVLNFFDAYMKDDSEAQKKLPNRCSLYTSGDDVWHETDRYPPSETTEQRYYLTSHGSANSLCGDGRLVTTAQSGGMPDSFLADWENPVPTLNPGSDARKIEDRMDVLVYTSDVLDQDVSVLGPVLAELYFSADALDADVVVRVEDVRSDGKAVLVTGELGFGVFRARYRHGFDQEVPLVPGETALLNFHVCHMGHTFVAGHRLRVSICATAGLIIEANHHTGQPVATAVDRRKAIETIYHDADRPSCIVLPVLAGNQKNGFDK